MPRLLRLLAAVLALALVAAACDDSDDEATDGAPATEEAEDTGTTGSTVPPELVDRIDPEAGGELIAVGGGEPGDRLIDGNGFSLYLFTNDEEGASSCSGGCATAWPPLLVDTPDVPVSDEIDASLVGTIERDDGTTQVTYAGHPLYYFSGDRTPGETNGHGSGGVWFLVAPGGEALEA